MKALKVKPGDYVETLPHVGVARGQVLERCIVDVGGREVWRWKVRLDLPSGTEDVYLRAADMDVIREGPPLELEELAAHKRRGKRRRGGAA